jgi:hypothetical protein
METRLWQRGQWILARRYHFFGSIDLYYILINNILIFEWLEPKPRVLNRFECKTNVLTRTSRLPIVISKIDLIFLPLSIYYYYCIWFDFFFNVNSNQTFILYFIEVMNSRLLFLKRWMTGILLLNISKSRADYSENMEFQTRQRLL